MTRSLNQLKIIATLHGVPITLLEALPITRKAFLQGCNTFFLRPDKLRAFKRATDQPIRSGPPTRRKQKNLTKQRKVFKGTKIIATESRLAKKAQFWLPVKLALQQFVQTKGNQAKIANALGIDDSQIHRWSCPVCEHDQEPSFSLGVALLLYLTTQSAFKI